MVINRGLLILQGELTFASKKDCVRCCFIVNNDGLILTAILD